MSIWGLMGTNLCEWRSDNNNIRTHMYLCQKGLFHYYVLWILYCWILVLFCAKLNFLDKIWGHWLCTAWLTCLFIICDINVLLYDFCYQKQRFKQVAATKYKALLSLGWLADTSISQIKKLTKNTKQYERDPERLTTKLVKHNRCVGRDTCVINVFPCLWKLQCMSSFMSLYLHF